VSTRIEDPGDPRLVDYVDLADAAARRQRERDTLFIAEGPVALEKLVASGHPIRSVLTTPKQQARVEAILGADRAPVLVVDADVMRATVGFDLHRGIVAAADRRPQPTVAALLAGLPPGPLRIAVLEGLNDPENLGLIARSARAFGVAALVLDPTCIDPYYRRTVRVSMGEILLLPVARCAAWPDELTLLRDAGFTTWALTPAPGADDIWTAARPERLALMVGAEGPGLTAAALGAADRRVQIPIDQAVDSINVGHAAAIAFAATGLVETMGLEPTTPHLAQA
jgi:tRNA G18 (ribose-2'-O)-methylase SpoU